MGHNERQQEFDAWWNECQAQRQQRRDSGEPRFRFLSRAQAVELFPGSILSFNEAFQVSAERLGGSAFTNAVFFIDSDPHPEDRSFWRVQTGELLCAYMGPTWNIHLWTGSYWQELETANYYDAQELKALSVQVAGV